MSVYEIFAIYDAVTVAQKREAIKKYASGVLSISDWTQLTDSGLGLAQQIEQQELRLAWAELDDPELDPDEIILPTYPMTERP